MTLRKASASVFAFIALFMLAACGTVPSRHLQAQTADTPTVVIPGMPSCCCQPPMPVPTDVPTALPTVGVDTAHSANNEIVAIDPGHGGAETGAVSASGLMEKSVNLKIALKLAALLRAGSFTPVLTRNSDTEVNTAHLDLNGDGTVNNDDDLQARVDIANHAHAAILISIHNDGSTDKSESGTKTFYCDARPFSAEDIRLARLLQSNLVTSIRASGYDTRDRDAQDDAPLKKPYGHLFVLGPLTPRVARASNMPGALGETLYLSNPTEAVLLSRDAVIQAIAEGYYRGIAAYFSRTP